MDFSDLNSANIQKHKKNIKKQENHDGLVSVQSNI